MAQNPIIYNDGGIHRFADYVSQIPDFLKAEEDVVVLLQVMSDYVNNAYRNIDTVEKFQFRFVAIDSNLTLIQNRVNDFINLLKRSEARSERVLYLAKPEGNPRDAGRSLYMEYINYNGTIDRFSSSVITIPKTSIIDGDKFYVNFTLDGEESNSGVYIYDKNADVLNVDPNGTTQDPFNDTPNEPFKTAIGLAPRMMEFTVSDISRVNVKKVATAGNLVYYEVFFNATITDIESVSSVSIQEVDIDGDGIKEKILIDYYNMIDTIPSVYDEDFEINFASVCTDFEWGMGYGAGLFYARDLTQFERTTGNTNRDNNNKYVDPIFSPNTTILDIVRIRDITTATNQVEVTVKGEHKLSINDLVSIKSTGVFDSKDNKVLSITSTKTFVIQNSSSGDVTGGIALLRNLFFSKKVDDPNNFELRINYNTFVGDTSFENGDKVARVKYEFDEITSTFDVVDGVDLDLNAIYPIHPTYFNKDDEIILRNYTGSILPNGLVEGDIYTISQLVMDGTTVIGFKLLDTTITENQYATGSMTICKVNRYFNTSDTVGNQLKVNDITGLSVGDTVRVRGETDTLILPGPLQEGQNYIIDSIDLDDDGNATLITFRDIELTPTGTDDVNFCMVVISGDLENVASVKINKVITRSEGSITLSAYRGDMISEGEIIRISSIGGANGVGTATIDTTATVWGTTSLKRIYYKNELVVYNGVRYRVLKTHQILESSTSNPVNNENYIVDMSDIITRKTLIEYNPYMKGMHRTYPLGVDEYPVYTEEYSDFADNLYIKKDQELTLKYGHKQREFIFNPRIAPADKLVRNGFMEIIKSDESNDAYVGDITSFIKAQTNEYKSLFGVSDSISSIVSMTVDGNIVTVITSKNHLFKTGYVIQIEGVDQPEYNGRFEITVVDEKIFTIEVAGTLTTPITGSMRVATYTNDIILPVLSITRSSATATVNTGDDHGYITGMNVVITGAVQAGYNGEHEITVISPNTFTYTVTGTEATPATTLTELTSVYSPQVGDFINVVEQKNIADNGTYLVTDLDWTLYDDMVISDPVELFTRQNLFDVSDTNPANAVQSNQFGIKSITYLGGRIVEVELYDPHGYIVGTTVNITGANQSEYNGRFTVDSISATSSTIFRYKIKGGVTPVSPATGKKLRCYSDEWYKFTLSDIQWQQKSNFNNAYIGNSIAVINGNGSTVIISTFAVHNYVVGDRVTIADTDNFDGTFIVNEVIDDTKFNFIGSTIASESSGRVYKGYKILGNQNKDNISLLTGVYDFRMANGVTLQFRDGDIVNVQDQYINYENGVYRVRSAGQWTRLDKKLVMKVRTATVDSYEDADYTGLYDDESPYIYRRYSDSYVENYMGENFTGTTPIYKVERIFASNFQFTREKVAKIDTIAPFHKQYDAKYDYNSVASRDDMSSDFKGVDDMGYPLVEKFERLAYIKDPSVIDMDLIEYLARLMGYDITSISDDIEESVIYNTEEERNLALRRAIQNLPQYYALKSTASGLDTLLLTFGIVGELITMWTRQENPYDDMVPDYELRGLQYAENENGKISSFVPTPHFKIAVEIEGNFDNQLLPSDERRITSQITRYKPINTVFDGIFRFLSAKLTARVTAGNFRTSGKFKAAVGFNDLIFDDEIENDCI
jgi:hypothetical protein